MKPTVPSVVALAYDDLCPFEFACAVEVFGLPRPELEANWYHFSVAAVEAGPIRGIGGLRIDADGGLELLERATMIIVPGWPHPDKPVPAPLVQALRAAHARGCRLASICAGAFVLAATGLLSGRRATTHWHHINDLARSYPDVSVIPDVLYVDEGTLITSAGSAAGLDMCLHLVRRDFGPKIANQVARRLVLPAHRAGNQAQYLARPVPARTGVRLGPLLDKVRANLSDQWTTARLASDAGISVRSLNRLFREATGLAPGQWLVTERISRAQELLEETTLSIERVALEVGFGSTSTLRAHFRKKLGAVPSTLRQKP
ncbi:transcriptional activator FtrA [Burkholderia multivorans]|uniref:Transcriptional activator FtrA n=1 Tax=Burkholderia multivorans TaxID=87883 RepID=A0ABD7L7B1_9BURK|nr:transcriptional regulator FtrA [Burkholderia multivorans]SAJ97428.1 transcriptional activator FtrA [Burkholderia multivorans]